MTTNPTIGRRTVLVGALVAGPAVALGGSQAATAIRTSRDVVQVVPGEPVDVDLTVRWRRLDSRAALGGLWANLLAGWLFDEGSGYAFADSSGRHDAEGQSFTLFMTGDAWNTTDSGLLGSIHQRGRRGKAVHLDGSQWLAVIPTADLAPDQSGFSITAWIRLEGNPTERATIVRVGPHVALAIRPDGYVYWSLTTAAGAPLSIRSQDPAEVDSWMHVAATVDPASGSLNLWVNGLLSAQLLTSPFSLDPPATVDVALGRGLRGRLDETTLHRGALAPGEIAAIRLLGLPRTFTQTKETLDLDREVFSHNKGSEPIPHPIESTSVMSLRFAATLTSEQGASPLNSVAAVFAPADFGCAWRATTEAAVYTSPLTGSGGTCETWYRPVLDSADPERLEPKQVFEATASSSSARLTLSTRDGRWQVDLTLPTGGVVSAQGPLQQFPPGVLAHVAVTWGAGSEGNPGVRLFVDGRPVAFIAAETDATTFDGTLSFGGTPAAPSYCNFEDARVSNVLFGWAGVCPRGQMVTDAAGLDLRDSFQRSVGSAPLWWLPGSGAPAWEIARRTWQAPESVGDDPEANLAVQQETPAGVHALYHPDAFAQACSIEAGVSVEQISDGWVGVFLRSGSQNAAFAGITFMLNPAQNQVRLAHYVNGTIKSDKVLTHDFAIKPKRIYEMTLTLAGDGIARGFLDQINVVSTFGEVDWPKEGLAGLVTDGAAASFGPVHFSALTPASPASRRIEIRSIPYGQGAIVAGLALTPFRWHKRRGLLPWQYTSQNPELAGNIAGGSAETPLRPIPSAHWRGEDSANSDLVVVDGTVWYLMRGNPKVTGGWLPARIGMLHVPVTKFDGLHFVDPNLGTHRVRGGGALLVANGDLRPGIDEPNPTNLNAPSSAYVGNHIVFFLGKESLRPEGLPAEQETSYGHFDLDSERWVDQTVGKAGWNDISGIRRLYGAPEIVSLRDPVTDQYRVVVFQVQDKDGHPVMATAVAEHLQHGVPQLVPGMPVLTWMSRANGRNIYGFRVLFDNGIYYLHYNDGPQDADWPLRFVLAATLDPYAGPWVENASTRESSSTYFRRGSVNLPDNGAIWQGTMFKLRGRYYMYYENFHAIEDVDRPYQHYGDPQTGSRVGFATA